MYTKRVVMAAVAMIACSRMTNAQTIFTNTRTEVAEMAGLWEVDSVQVSPLANAQYPSIGGGTNLWQFLSPSGGINSDGDEDIEMAINSSGTGNHGGNQGYSPIHTEVINQTSGQLNHLQAIAGQQGKPRGIFRFYTEHQGERQFEIHPISEVDTWSSNVNAFVFDSDYHGNIVADPNGTTHAQSTLQNPFNGSETFTAQVMADNTNIIFTYPSPNVNYVQYGGTALSPLLADAVSPYFYFNPTSAYTSGGQVGISLPGVAVRCRVITNTAAAMNATGMASNQALSVVNGLLRTDMIGVSNDIASLSANQSSTFVYPNELILLGLTGPSPVPYLYVTPSASSYSSSGGKGGPFTPSTNTYNLVNIGSGTVAWSVTNNTSWLTISPASGTLAAGANTNVTVFLNANANNLFPGTYSSTVTFTNTTNGAGGTTSVVSLAVSGSPFQNIQTVFIILEENQNWASISGNAACPYINNGLLPKSSYALQYYNPPGNHPSLPNYLWLEAGTNFGILADGDALTYHESTTNHLVTLLKNAGISWTSFQEGITGTACPLTDSGQYVAKHNPMVHFDDVTNTNSTGSTYCISNVRPFTELAGYLQSNTVTRYNFIAPNLCDDMHGNTGCLTGNALLTAGDTWLSNTVAEIVSSQAYSNNGAIFVTWDEGEGGDGPIGMIVLSPLAKGAGYSNTVHYTHSSTLLTMEEIFSVGPLLGDAANATDLSDLFAFGPAQMSVTPAVGLTAYGQIGGPFTPGSQLYALHNSGGAALSWVVTNSSSWSTISATNGVLAGAATTNITVSINATANSLTAGSYSDTLYFVNVSNGSGTIAEPISLTVSNASAQLSVSPSSGFTSGGTPGGPFFPASQAYTVSNTGQAPMNWTANNSAAWLTLSPTSGSLASGASTNVTATINANANSLASGSYSDTIGFTNVTNGAGNTTRAVTLGVSNFGFYDDFSTFASGSLVGQHAWTQLGTISSSSVQITNGQAAFTGGLLTNSQTAYKNVTLTNETVYYGMTLTVTNAPYTNGPPYFATFYTGSNASPVAQFRLTAASPNAAMTNYALGIRITVSPSDTNSFGTGLTYGTQYRVIVQAMSGTNAMIYVNPTSPVISAQTPYATNAISGITTVGSVAISQLDNGTVPSVGGSIGKFVVADNFATVYTDLLGPTPPTASFTANPTNGLAPLSVTFTDTSTGNVTNWFWNFGDGGTTNLTTNTVLYTYNTAGVYTVTEIVTGAGGSSTDTVANAITVTSLQPPVALFTGSPTNGVEPLTVAFTDTSMGLISSRYWDFGDSSTTNVTTNGVSHTYAAGTYNVMLIVTGPGGSGTNIGFGYITAFTTFQSWQNQYFGTNSVMAAPGADPLGKGISNTNQFLMGLNPTNPASAFRIISVVKTGTDVVVTWQTSGGDASGLFGSGKTNVLEVTPGLPDGSYSNNFVSTGVTNVITTLGDVITNAVDAGGATNVPSRYYQIQFIAP